MEFLIRRDELQLLFSVCRTMTYNLGDAGVLTLPIKWNGDTKVMYSLQAVADELAKSNYLEPPSEETRRQFRESILYLRRLELMEAKAAKKAKKAEEAKVAKKTTRP